MKKRTNWGILFSLLFLLITTVIFDSKSGGILLQMANTPISHAFTIESDTLPMHYTPEMTNQHDQARTAITPRENESHHHQAILARSEQICYHNMFNAPYIISVNSPTTRQILSTKFVEHSPITIDGNADLITQATTEDWPGDGIESNPYIIDGYEISGTISIMNTDKYFMISNCILANGYSGIDLYNVINGEVSNNVVNNTQEGISLDNCQYIKVSKNSVSNTNYGISLFYSSNNIITSNTLVTGGLFIFGEEFDDFMQTEVTGNTVDGKPLVYWQSTIGGSVPTGAGQVVLVNCTSVEVKDQILANLSVGLVTAFSSNLNIHNNTIANNIRGIYLRLSSNNTVVSNNFYANNRGLFLSDTGNNIVTNNTFINDGLYIYGEILENALQVEVSSNTVNNKPLIYWQNIVGGTIPYGVGQAVLVNCTSVEISGQNLVNTSVGLIMVFCYDLDVHNNIIANNFWGIYLCNSYNNTFTRNIIADIEQYTLFFDYSANNYFIFNYFYNGEGTGYFYDTGTNNVLAYNYWSENTSPDSDGDGIVDVPYYISSFFSDLTPLVSSNTHILFAPNLIPRNKSENLPNTITIQWLASLDSLGHDITYSIYYSLDNDKTWIQLASDLNTTKYKWDSIVSDTKNSFYLIKIVATCSEGLMAEAIAFNYNIDSPRIAYIYSTSISAANSYKSLLKSNDFLIDLIAMDTITDGMFNPYDLILIGTETSGTLGGYSWGDENKVAAIDNSRKPIIGLGFGGASFFGQLDDLSITWGHSWIGSDDSIVVMDSSHQIFTTPNSIGQGTIKLYTSTRNSGVYLPTPADDIVLFGRESTDDNHYSIVQEKNRYLLWGFSATPNSMTQTGKDLFINILVYFEALTVTDPIVSDNTFPLPNSGFIIPLFFILVISVGISINIISHYRKRKKPIPRPYFRTTPTTSKELTIQKEISTIEPKLSEKIIPQEPTEPSPDLPSLKPLPERPKPELFIPVVTFPDTEPSRKATIVTPPKKPVGEDKRSLFSSIQYQVQDLIFEQGDTGLILHIIPYSGSIKEIIVGFSQNQILFSGCLKRQNIPRTNFELKIDGEPREPSWDDPWRDITLIGEEKIISRVKQRNEIANRLTSLGTAFVKVESPTKGEICLQLTCNETKEAIKLAYSLIKDLQLFFDISLY